MRAARTRIRKTNKIGIFFILFIPPFLLLHSLNDRYRFPNVDNACLIRLNYTPFFGKIHIINARVTSIGKKGGGRDGGIQIISKCSPPIRTELLSTGSTGGESEKKQTKAIIARACGRVFLKEGAPYNPNDRDHGVILMREISLYAFAALFRRFAKTGDRSCP